MVGGVWWVECSGYIVVGGVWCVVMRVECDG